MHVALAGASLRGRPACRLSLSLPVGEVSQPPNLKDYKPEGLQTLRFGKAGLCSGRDRQPRPCADSPSSRTIPTARSVSQCACAARSAPSVLSAAAARRALAPRRRSSRPRGRRSSDLRARPFDDARCELAQRPGEGVAERPDYVVADAFEGGLNRMPCQC